MTGIGSLSGPRVSLSSEYYITITQCRACYCNVTCSWNNKSILILSNASHRSLIINLRLSKHRCLIGIIPDSTRQKQTLKPCHILNSQGDPHTSSLRASYGVSNVNTLRVFFCEISRVQCMYCMIYYLWHTYCFFIIVFVLTDGTLDNKPFLIWIWIFHLTEIQMPLNQHWLT